MSLLLPFEAAFGAGTGKHPSLVDPAKAKCATCHEAVLQRKVKHAPAVKDCLSCHVFSSKDGQLTVALTSKEPALCVRCHPSLTASAEGHLLASHAPVTDFCVGCHSPHSADEPHLLTSPAVELCTICHPADELTTAHKVPVGRSSCIACHAPHGSTVLKMLVSARQHKPFAERSCDGCHRKGFGSKTRLKRSGAALCYACHSDLEARFSKGVVHGAVRQGKCTGCHSPHVAVEKKLLVASGARLCASCHASQAARASGPGGHKPARDCLTCHAPHQSAETGLLVKPVPALCVSCHAKGDKDGALLSSKHLGADLTKLSCTSCHDPHGSPVKGLIADGSIHPPFADSGCDRCHEGSAGKLTLGGGTPLCGACHAEIEQSAGTAAFPHAAVTVGECVMCHTPHASAQKRLLQAPSTEICGACHDDKVAKRGEFTHGVVTTMGCQACHEPHGGSRKGLLRAEGSQLCLTCHGPSATKVKEGAATVVLLGRELPVEQAQRMPTIDLSSKDGKHNHPITGHRALGQPTAEELKRTSTTFKEGELTCTTCHDPHKGVSRELPRAAKGEAPVTCATCHPK